MSNLNTAGVAKSVIIAAALFALWQLTGWAPFLWLLIAWLIVVILANLFNF